MRTVISVTDLQGDLERERARCARREDALRRVDEIATPKIAGLTLLSCCPLFGCPVRARLGTFGDE